MGVRIRDRVRVRVRVGQAVAHPLTIVLDLNRLEDLAGD